MRSTWTDSRLDEFKDRVDSRLGELSGQLNEQGARIDRLQHTMVQAFIALMVAMFTGFATLAGLIITQI